MRLSWNEIRTRTAIFAQEWAIALSLRSQYWLVGIR